MSELSTSEARKLMEVYKSMCASQQENISEEVEQIDEAQIVPAAAKVNQQTTKPRPGESAADARTRAGAVEYTRRGGLVGQLGRTLTRGFGSNKDIAKVDAADKASQARINQRVAATQGKYYSSSDQKTYANYNDAVAARNSRLNVKPDSKPAGSANPPAGSANPPAGTKTAPAASSTVLAKQGGVEGKLDKATGKFTAGAFTGAERDRYVARSTPAPGTKAAGPESIKPKTPNPLMQKTFGYQTGNAPDQIKKASEGKPVLPASTTALGSAAKPEVRSALGLKPLTTPQATAAAPKPAAATPEVKVVNTAAAAPKPIPAAPMSPREKSLSLQRQSYEYDAYDLVLEYLLDNGHVDSVDEAHYVMLEMDSQTIQSIVEETTTQRLARRASEKADEPGAKTEYKPQGPGFKNPRSRASIMNQIASRARTRDEHGVDSQYGDKQSEQPRRGGRKGRGSKSDRPGTANMPNPNRKPKD
jgi:hypothetical protein